MYFRVSIEVNCNATLSGIDSNHPQVTFEYRYQFKSLGIDICSFDYLRVWIHVTLRYRFKPSAKQIIFVFHSSHLSVFIQVKFNAYHLRISIEVTYNAIHVRV
ncbi:hypothetical protein CDAR_167621 [Caerostris darwini]|uniref:Uncharacterized protein n=1 Tax=Caerostris darwini TaxID=1538125 RepID=A0AAV4M7Z7_9ARAC|nr:hypothetical protein CDAR_167621 [Caerostris darwini]